LTATKTLSFEEIARELDRMRAQALAVKHREFRAVAAEDLENAYGDITEAALTASFASKEHLANWVHEALRRDALDIVKAARFHVDDQLPADDAASTLASGAPSVEEIASRREVRELLHEFLAELSEQDRQIAYLHLDPDFDWTPRRIASALDLPKQDVRRTLDRIGVRLRRFTALYATPGALCPSASRSNGLAADRDDAPDAQAASASLS
jgi:RNA polymerase sigma factor (sigma-70 family)